MQPASAKTNAVSAAAVVAGEAVPAERASVDTAGGAAQRVEHTEQEAAVPSKVNAASVAAPAAQQAQQRTARIKAEQPAGTTVQHVQPVNENDVVDITADDTDSSQLSAEPVLNSAAAEIVQAPASVSDITMAEVTQEAATDQSRGAAEAFISLEPEAATGSKAVSPTNPAQPSQAAQGLQSIVIPSQQSADATAAAPAKDALGKQLVGVDDSLTVLGLQPLPAHRKPLSAAASADSRPASANGRPASVQAAATSSMLYPDQKALPASKTKAAGKGGIQIVMATKHKEVISLNKFLHTLRLHSNAYTGFQSIS